MLIFGGIRMVLSRQKINMLNEFVVVYLIWKFANLSISKRALCAFNVLYILSRWVRSVQGSCSFMWLCTLISSWSYNQQRSTCITSQLSISKCEHQHVSENYALIGNWIWVNFYFYFEILFFSSKWLFCPCQLFLKFLKY